MQDEQNYGDKDKEHEEVSGGGVCNKLVLLGLLAPQNPSCAHFAGGTMLAAPAVDLRGESLYYSRLT